MERQICDHSDSGASGRSTTEVSSGAPTSNDAGPELAPSKEGDINMGAESQTACSTSATESGHAPPCQRSSTERSCSAACVPESSNSVPKPSPPDSSPCTDNGEKIEQESGSDSEYIVVDEQGRPIAQESNDNPRSTAERAGSPADAKQTDVTGGEQRPSESNLPPQPEQARGAFVDANIGAGGGTDGEGEMEQLGVAVGMQRLYDLGDCGKPVLGILEKLSGVGDTLKSYCREGEIGDETVLFGRQIKYWSEATLRYEEPFREFRAYAVDLETGTMAESEGRHFRYADRAAQSAVYQLIHTLRSEHSLEF
eukprot:scpid69292/ scgid10869/ 